VKIANINETSSEYEFDEISDITYKPLYFYQEKYLHGTKDA